MIRFLICIAFLATTIYGADHNLFKNCSRVPFCSRLRSQTLNEDDEFFAVTTSLKLINATTLVVPLRNSLNETASLQMSFYSKNQVRIQIIPTGSSRYELQDVLADDAEPIRLKDFGISGGGIYMQTEDDLYTYRVVLTNEVPFQINFYYDNKLQVVLNGDRFVLENSADSEAIGFGVEFDGANKLYGLYHHASNLALDETADGSSDPFRFRNSDTGYYEVDSPMALYGSIPVVYGHSENKTSGVFFHNAAEQWVDIDYKENNASAYFMTESGSFDLFVLLGPTPKDVVRQYTDLTGVAHLPQIWTLGYHQCRNSYNTQEDVKEVIAQMDAHDFPMDAIWLDIDYTDGKRYFTWDPNTFSDPVEMQKNISSTGRKLVAILDPHIKVEDSYSVYAGAKEKHFIKWANGSDFQGNCWPGLSSYLDFLNPEVRDYYAGWYSYDKFNGSTETLAGIWNDMNEPSVFDMSSSENTMPFETLHNGNVLHRDVHNIYGLLHTKATHQGLMQRDNGTKRPFVLTRSHFAGSQRYAAIWTGDNQADWPYLAISYPECMISNILGTVFCGADIGGFINNPDVELLQRWYQAGIWLPFFRQHSSSGTERREPYLYDEDVQSVIRDAIKLRYKHLPVFYTLFYEHTRNGDPIVRPLFYDYPSYFENQDHILLGRDVLARPVLEPNVERVAVEFPGGETNYWFRVDNGSWAVHPGGSFENIEVDITTTPFFYRGGSIVLRKDTERPSTSQMLQDPYTLYINLDSENSANGRLYIDDYTSFEYANGGSYLYLNMTYLQSTQDLRLHTIDGNSTGMELSIESIIIHSRSDDGTKETVFTTTSDGTPLESIDIVSQLNSLNDDVILKL